MSGFAVEIAFDDRPIPQGRLDRLTRSLRYRAPDGERTQLLDRAGFAFARMQIEGDPPTGAQPLCLDGRWWIVAHARLYARGELIQHLRAAGASPSEEASDALLILLANRAWGTRCLHRLNGDFSFALWDCETRELFCACDHFGMRPLFYSCVGQAVRVSNTLTSLRDGFDDATELDDAFIADFLAFEFSLEPEATAYRRIRRLPPAHYLLVRSGQAPIIRRYWNLPAQPAELRLSPDDSLHEFRQLFEAAVRDRLPAGPVALWLSGGMDSTAIAAIAANHMSARSGSMRIATFTAGLSHPSRDPEPPLAALVAGHLGVPNHLFDIEAHKPFERWDECMPFMPEPWHEPYWGRKVIGLKEVARRNRVTIGGEGGDELLCPELTLDLFGRFPVRRLAAEVIRHWIRYGRLPPMGIRKTVHRWRGLTPDYGAFARVPPWLNRDFAVEWRLAERMADFYRTADDPTTHPTRPMGLNRLNGSTQMTRDSGDPGTIGLPLELRKPFLDLRLVEFMYSIPPLYWCSRKAILREALAGRLPHQILGRAKTSVPGNLLWEHVTKFGMPWLDRFQPASALEHYIDLSAWRGLCERARAAQAAPPTLLRDLLPVSLNFWLQSLAQNA